MTVSFGGCSVQLASANRVNTAFSATTHSKSSSDSTINHNRNFSTSLMLNHDNLNDQFNRMDPKFCFPASPGTPLFAVSPERVNRQPVFSQSPSLPSDLANLSDPFTTIHARTSSDVQGKVAQFNNLSKEAIQRRKDNEAALKRAVMGREEAESETRRLKEENRVLRGEIEEGRGRERRVAERLESVMV